MVDESKLGAFLRNLQEEQMADAVRVTLVRMFASFQFFSMQQVRSRPSLQNLFVSPAKWKGGGFATWMSAWQKIWDLAADQLDGLEWSMCRTLRSICEW